MTYYYSLHLPCFVVPIARLAVYYPLTLLDEIQCEVSVPILLPGHRDTMIRVGEKIAEGSSLRCT